MKNKSFDRRLRFALQGWAIAARAEASFRTQLVAAACAFVVLLVLRPAPLWWALFSVTIAGVLGAELFNTALERVIDRLHPEKHPIIAEAKDCAAGAVLVFSVASLAVLAALLFERFA